MLLRQGRLRGKFCGPPSGTSREQAQGEGGAYSHLLRRCERRIPCACPRVRRAFPFVCSGPAGGVRVGGCRNARTRQVDLGKPGDQSRIGPPPHRELRTVHKSRMRQVARSTLMNTGPRHKSRPRVPSFSFRWRVPARQYASEPSRPETLMPAEHRTPRADRGLGCRRRTTDVAQCCRPLRDRHRRRCCLFALATV